MINALTGSEQINGFMAGMLDKTDNGGVANGNVSKLIFPKDAYPSGIEQISVAYAEKDGEVTLHSHFQDGEGYMILTKEYLESGNPKYLKPGKVAGPSLQHTAHSAHYILDSKYTGYIDDLGDKYEVILTYNDLLLGVKSKPEFLQKLEELFNNPASLVDFLNFGSKERTSGLIGYDLNVGKRNIGVRPDQNGAMDLIFDGKIFWSNSFLENNSKMPSKSR